MFCARPGQRVELGETTLKLWKTSGAAISQTLSNSAKLMPKMSSGGSKTPIYQKGKLLQIVAECCKMLQDTVPQNRNVRQSQEPPHRNRRPEITQRSRNPVLRIFHPCNVASPSPNLARRATPRDTYIFDAHGDPVTPPLRSLDIQVTPLAEPNEPVKKFLSPQTP